MNHLTTTFLFLLLAGLSIVSHAQPIVQANNLPPLGTKAYIRTISSTVNPLTLGANVVWDLSSATLDPLDSNISVTTVTSASTPFGATFPTANFCYKVVYDSSTMYQFSRFDSSEVDELASNYNGTPSSTLYSVPKIFLKFPFHYVDSTTAPFQITGQAMDTMKLSYIAYGTLKTPFGIFNNVVLIKSVADNDPKYVLWNTNPVFPLFQYDNATLFQPLTFTGIDDAINNRINSVVLSPNPSTGSPSLTFGLAEAANLNITACDVTGREIRQLFNGKGVEGINQLTIDDSHFSPGIYIITILANHATQQVKYVKTR